MLRKKSIISLIAALVVALSIAAMSASAGVPINGMNTATGNQSKFWSTRTADGLRLSLKLNANVRDGEESPFWLQIWRVGGNPNTDLVSVLGQTFDHSNAKLVSAAYRVPDGGVTYWLKPRAKKAQAPTATSMTTQPTTPQATSGANTDVNWTSSGATDNTSSKLVKHASNLQFVDPKHVIVRVGKLKVGEHVEITGMFRAPDRTKVGAEDKLYSILQLGTAQWQPGDAEYPEFTWSLRAASMYIAK